MVWFRVYGSDAEAPAGYSSCGFDITYAPDINGAFSIINDCLFICRWHGCDKEGTAILAYFNALNPNGLFAFSSLKRGIRTACSMTPKRRSGI